MSTPSQAKKADGAGARGRRCLGGPGSPPKAGPKPRQLRDLESGPEAADGRKRRRPPAQSTLDTERQGIPQGFPNQSSIQGGPICPGPICPFLLKELYEYRLKHLEPPQNLAAGLLIAIVTVAGVLSGQGIDLGRAGSGTVVTLIGALATALLGLLAQDPGQSQSNPSSSTGATAKLGVWALIALLFPLPFMTGCSATSVAQDIVNWTPALQSAVATVDTTAALLAPADAPIFAAATVGFDAASNLLVTQARAYLANPSASLLAQIRTQVVAFQQQVDASVLAAVKIVDPASQKHALSAIQVVATVVSAIVALVQSISSKAAVTQMAAHSTVKLASVEPYLDRSQAVQIVAAHYGEPLGLAAAQVAQAERSQLASGF